MDREPWRRKVSDTTEQLNWTELILYHLYEHNLRKPDTPNDYFLYTTGQFCKTNLYCFMKLNIMTWLFHSCLYMINSFKYSLTIATLFLKQIIYICMCIYIYIYKTWKSMKIYQQKDSGIIVLYSHTRII